MAKDGQILADAVLAIDYRYPTGTTFDSPSVFGEFFRAKLAGRNREVFACLITVIEARSDVVSAFVLTLYCRMHSF